jgi:hypothetical protein
MREVATDEVGDGRFYALDGCHIGFYSLELRLESAATTARCIFTTAARIA